MELAKELKILRNMRLILIRNVFSALRMVPKGRMIGGIGNQTTPFLKSARMLRRVLET